MANRVMSADFNAVGTTVTIAVTLHKLKENIAVQKERLFSTTRAKANAVEIEEQVQQSGHKHCCWGNRHLLTVVFVRNPH